MTRYMMLVSLFLLYFSGVSAAPLYLDLIENTKPDKKEIEAARKQIKEHVEIKIKDELFISPFHKRGNLPDTEKKPICSLCHLSLPHQKNERSRSFLNMHSRYITCETCHLKTEGYQIEHRWVDFKSREKAQQPGNRQSENLEYESIQREPGMRITPFYSGEAAIIFSDHPYSRKLEKTWGIAGDEEKIKLKASLHSILNKEGARCKACHGKKDLLVDFTSLGATEKQARAIEENIIAKFFARFKKDDEKLRITNLLR